ncbi:hypothetical protein [Bdellovibrio sp. HCB337]|uniref:hypothetical protein n=1 Tax=Bdellovibrio sp. HCB337 TaxID=3394358 RepID=UPI0039A701E1
MARKTIKKKTTTRKPRTQSKKKGVKGAFAGGILGAVVGLTIGGIGIAAMGTAIGIPAVAVVAALGAGGAVAGNLTSR